MGILALGSTGIGAREIQHLAVHPRARWRGDAAGMLARKGLSELARRGCTVVRSQAATSNRPSHHLNVRFGMERMGRIQEYRLGLQERGAGGLLLD